ncbi:MAG: excinuclease ABC subunit UvrA [Vampirovibrionales bacterium]|nr:excinuclease ABC subunit UvrA [Vampirovibrionales bacterium]
MADQTPPENTAVFNALDASYTSGQALLKTHRLDQIRIIGANDHNLKQVSLALPRNRLIAFSGVSGSGKSTLAFDTIFAEGQRRYVESLNTYARQFVGQFKKPDVTLIEGLSPAIAIDQKTTGNSPRSTVGTVTEIYDFLRVLYARVGLPHCPDCGHRIGSQSAKDILESVCKVPENSRLQILAPIVRGRKGSYGALLEQLQKEGVVRVRIDGETVLLDDPDAPLPTLSKTHKHTIEAVIDRILFKDTEAVRARVMTAIQTALRKSKGYVIAQVLPLPSDSKPPKNRFKDTDTLNGSRDLSQTTEAFFSRHMACPQCDVGFEEMAPRLFSFNSRYGACPDCDGLGVKFELDPEKLVPDQSKSLKQGALVLLKGAMGSYYERFITLLAKKHAIDTQVAYQDLPESQKQLLLYGPNRPGDSERVRDLGASGDNDGDEDDWFGLVAGFDGLVPMLNRKLRHAEGAAKSALESLMLQRCCGACNGARLKPLSRAVTLGGLPIDKVCQKSMAQLVPWFEALPEQLNERQQLIASQGIQAILRRLKILNRVGVGYIALDRAMVSLSGGEAQRVRLATQIGSELSGVLYVLDEPSIGLHPANTQQLIETLKQLRDEGNTVLVVEHDEETLSAADWLVDIGPGAGKNGGQIVAEGPPDALRCYPEVGPSETAQLLQARTQPPEFKTPRVPKAHVKIEAANLHNLKQVNVEIPLGVMTVVCGLSGSGKSTLVFDVLGSAAEAYTRALQKKRRDDPMPELTEFIGAANISGLSHLDRVIEIDQSPVGRTPRSNPATYVGIMDSIRKVFAATEDAKLYGYGPGRFSFNTSANKGGGRCETCKGAGRLTLTMSFLPDAYTDCPDCHGLRYNADTLRVKYNGAYSIADILSMPIGEACHVFEFQTGITRMLQVLCEIGLDYLTLGQPATTLSGGEAQRMRLAAELVKKGTGQTLYIMDEPSTGLHGSDLKKLLAIMQQLVDAGNTVLVIEHHLDVIRAADWCIDMGPGAGEAGGRVVFAGPPEALSRCSDSVTGQALGR